MTDLSTLIPRIEQAGVDEQRELLEAVWEALKMPSPDRFNVSWWRFAAMLEVDAYESAAFSLMPETCRLRVLSDSPVGDRSHVTLLTEKHGHLVDGAGATKALALLAAICRAHVKEGEDA